MLLDIGKRAKYFASCGYTGFLMLLRIIREISKNVEIEESKVLCNEHPTYYGMMVVKMNFSEKKFTTQK
jgi:aromatic ring-opening dioxygenase LigB subunit